MVKKEKEKEKRESTALKLDLKETLTAIDNRDYNYYNSLSDEMKKKYVGFVLIRFISSAQNQGRNHEYFLYAVNDIVNRNFFTISKNHPELIHLLLCVCGRGSTIHGDKVYHKWIANKKSSIAWTELFHEKYGKLSELEIKILKNNHTEEEIYQIAMNLGKTEKEANDYVKSFQKT